MTWDLFWMIILIWLFIGLPLTFFVAAMLGKKGVSVTDDTLRKVYISMDEAGVPFTEGMDAITKMHEKGIRFVETGPAKDKHENEKESVG